MGEELPRLRATPEDFFVDEIPLYPASGEGGHTFVRIEKSIRTTEGVARDLAKCAGCRPRDVGYAGRKDRFAVTRQWFSVPELDPAESLKFEISGAKILESARHPHKLRTGHLRGNRFKICVRGCSDEVIAHAKAAIPRIVTRGLPNRFGEQRFGRKGDNAEQARKILAGGPPGRDRRASRFLLSALQAEVFNEVLRARPLPLDRVEAGEIAMVMASGGPFVVEEVERENERVARFEISPTGPIFGSRTLAPVGPPALREAAALEALGVPASTQWNLPKGIRLKGSRRSLRVQPRDLCLEMLRSGDLTLAFELPAGSYATVLIDEVVGPVCLQLDTLRARSQMFVVGRAA